MVMDLVGPGLGLHRQVGFQTKKNQQWATDLAVEKIATLSCILNSQNNFIHCTHKCSLENNYFNNYQFQQISSSVIWD